MFTYLKQQHFHNNKLLIIASFKGAAKQWGEEENLQNPSISRTGGNSSV